MLRLFVLAALAASAGAKCVLELAVSAQDSVLDVSGTLGALLDIELKGLPPQASGTLLLSTPGACPSTPEGWNDVDATLSSSAISVVPDLVQLSAAVVHINVTGAKFAFGPAALRRAAQGGGVLHAAPAVRMVGGTAKIGQRLFDLTGGRGLGSLNATFASTEAGAVELSLPEMRAVFEVGVPDIEGRTQIVVEGSMVAVERQTIERALSPVAAAPPSDPAFATSEPEPAGLRGDGAAKAASGVVCDPACSTHGTCEQDPDGAPGVGRCKCACNFIGETCSTYAPLRLASVEPSEAEFGKPIRVKITGKHLGELAGLPPPDAKEGPPFRVATKGGDACSELSILDESTIQCTLPPQLPGTTISFDVKRGCASAPFSPSAMLTIAGCGDPSKLVCGSNQRARADGCGCECLPGYRGEMCNACAADVACANIARTGQSPDEAAAAAADAVNAAAGRLRAMRRLGQRSDARKETALGLTDPDAGALVHHAANASAAGGQAEEEEPLTCRMGDFDYYAGTYQKVLSCSMRNLPEGIEPLTISLACERDSLSAKATCRLLVAPEDDEDRAEVGYDGWLNCLATGCTLDEGEPTGHCEDVSCSFGIYEPAIRAAMPDLQVGGPSNIECKQPAGKSKGAEGGPKADAVANCFVDVDVLPFDIMAECMTSDCVDPSMLVLDLDGQSGIVALAIGCLAAGICVISLLLLWCCRAMRMQPMGQAAPAGEEAGFSAPHMQLPNDLNQMPRIDKLVFEGVRVRVASGREIVRGASGVARAGEVYGVIGASGSGKTTLLDAVAGVLSPGATREGRVLVAGHEIPEHGVRLPAMVGYVRQEDNLSLTLTPRECVWFSAQLTLPIGASKADKCAAVDGTLRSLGLAHIADTQLGGNAAALARVSGGERRRVAIAMSMVCSPRVLLLDEPTSGLDSASAHRLVSTLRQLASNDRVVMLSIHQPAQRTFELLSCALLMHQGAPVVVGDVRKLLSRVDAAGVPCPAGYNLADHLLDVTSDAGAVQRLREGAAADLTVGAREAAPTPDGPAPWDAVRAARGWRGGARHLALELRALYWRIGLNVYRHPALLRLHIGMVVVLGGAIGLVFHGVGDNLASFQNRSGACFFVLALFGFSGLSAMEVFISEQEIMLRELQAGYYRLLAYFVAKVSTDALLLRALPAILFSLIFYPTMGLRAELPRFETFVTVATLVNIASGLLCAAISVCFDSLGAANLSATILMLLLLLMNGALVNLREVARPLQLVQSTSYFRYGFEALMANELDGTIVMVDAPGIMPIPVKSRVFLGVLGMDVEQIGRDKRVLLGFCVGHALLALALLYYRSSTWRLSLAFRSKRRAPEPPRKPREVEVAQRRNQSATLL